MSTYKTYLRGATAIPTCAITDADNAAASPVTSTKVTVVDPTGTTVVDDKDMEEAATGSFYYDYDTDSDNALGTYQCQYIGISAGRTYIGYGEFTIEDPLETGKTGQGYLEYTLADLRQFVKDYLGGDVDDRDANRYVAAGLMRVVKGLDPRSDPPTRHQWSFLRPRSSMTLWATATGTMSVSTVTVTDATNCPFYESMVGHTLVADTSENEYTIASYTSSSVIVLTASAAADDGDTFTITANGRYAPPAGFGGMIESPVYAYAASGNTYNLTEVSPETIYVGWRGSNTAGDTVRWALEPQTFTASAGQKYWFIVDPVPDEDMVTHLRMVKRVTDPAIGEYIIGADIISEAVRDAVLAEAEIITGHTAGVWAARAQASLCAAIDDDTATVQTHDVERMSE